MSPDGEAREIRDLPVRRPICHSLHQRRTVMETKTHETTSTSEVRPFRINVPEEDLVDLRRRLAATRWPSRELVTDRSQGVQLATNQDLAPYWATDYDCRRCQPAL